MFQQLMSARQKQVSWVLFGALGLTMSLWLFRSPEPLLVRLIFVGTSILMAPIAYLGMYGILHVSARVNHASERSFRRSSAFFFFGAAGFLLVSAIFTFVQFARGRPAIAANTLALGAALGVMKAWNKFVQTKGKSEQAR
jgi:hypothetical protein